MQSGEHPAAGGVLDPAWTIDPAVGRDHPVDPPIPHRLHGRRGRGSKGMDDGLGRVASALMRIDDWPVAEARCDSSADAAPAPVCQPVRPWSPRQGAERRDFPRHPSGCRVAVCRLSDSAALTAQQRNWKLHATPIRGELADISLTGAAFWLDQELAAGEDVYVRLSDPGTSRTLDVPARVLRAEPMPTGADDVADPTASGHAAAGHAASGHAASGHAAAVRIVCVFRRRLAVHELREFSHACLPLGVV